MKFNEMFDIKEDEDNIPADSAKKPNILKHVLLRLGALVIGIALIFLGCYLSGEYSGMLAAFYLSAYFLGIWLLFLSIETIALYIGKRNEKAGANLAVLVIFISFLALFIVKFA